MPPTCSQIILLFIVNPIARLQSRFAAYFLRLRTVKFRVPAIAKVAGKCARLRDE